MSTLKKILVAWIMATTSFFSFAASNGIGGYWVHNIVPNAQAVQSTLMQSVTKANYACGPTSLLFVSNHYKRLDTGQNSLNMSTVDASKRTLGEIYKYLSLDYNISSGTSLDQIKAVAKGKYLWTNVYRASASNTVEQNMDSLIDYMNRNIPVLAVLRGSYVGNPVKPYDHIVIIFAYNRRTDELGRAPLDPKNSRKLDTIDWYEPYYGKQGTVLRQDVASTGSKSAFNITNFSFLATGRGVKRDIFMGEFLLPQFLSKYKIMKKYYTLPTICFILSGVTIFLIGYLWKTHYNNNRFSNDTGMTYSGRTLLPGEEICGSQDIECPELQKINDRIGFTNDITATSYVITTGSGGEIIATINFPAFSEHTPEEKREIFQKIKASNAKVLALGIIYLDQGYEAEIRDILLNVSFNELHIQLYAEPENIIELFDIITWKQNENMKLTLEFINLRLPTDIKIFNYIYMSEKMILRNNNNLPLKSFSIVFNPLFDEFDGLYDRYILYPVEKKLLMNIPTNKLNIKGLHTTYTNRTDGMYENQKGKTYDFLKNNPIPDIYIDSIGKKENGDITLTGF